MIGDTMVREPPDALRSRRVAWITTDLVALDDPDRDVGPVTAALAATGVDVEAVKWQDSAGTDWSRFDVALLRSPWDYSDHLAEFLEWLDEVERAVPVLNSPGTIRWNLDKSYLVELAGRGVPVVPTTFCDTLADVDEAIGNLATSGASRVVVKPDVSAGSRDTGLFAARDDLAMELAGRILGRGRRVIVQPEVPGVATDGERGFVVVDGVFSHAIHKGPILLPGGGLVGGVYTEHVTAVPATTGEVALAERVVAACPGPVPLYARIDLVATPQGPLLLEAELFEPSLFCDLVDGSAERFAAAIVARLG